MGEAARVCRSCGWGELVPVLSLGSTPLANALLSEQDLGKPEATYPLDVVMCRGCSLVQLGETVPPEALFTTYPYFSSFSASMVRHARESAISLQRECGLGRDSRVIEIASNDGYLLTNFVAAGIPVLGIEPATNVAAVAEERGVPTICSFFDRSLAQDLARGGMQADVILANNVMAHVPDINGVAEGIATLLKGDGVFVMETPYVRDLVSNLEFDTIYHEHVFYYSLTALNRLFSRHRLEVVRVEHLPIHGGTLRVTAGHAGRQTPDPGVRQMLDQEAAAGMLEPGYYSRLAERIAGLRHSLLELLRRLKADGARIAAYGASAKGSTLLNVFGIGCETLDFVADRSTVKQGLFMPGTHIPIVPPNALLERRPEYVLLLTWNFRDEILEQQSAYRAQGGKFIIPVPEVEIV